jgi:N-methylhydantoinase B
MEDFSCGLFDMDGYLVAQGEDHPGHLVPVGRSIRTCIKELETLGPGDIGLHNDGYTGGTHLNDVLTYLPVYYKGEPLVYVAIMIHWPDVGGSYPGSYSGLNTSIYQEGVRIPPIKICENGKFNEGVLKLVYANMRNPDNVRGDFFSSIAGINRAKDLVLELAERYGGATIHQCINEMFDLSETRMRQRISEIPDGDYYYEDYQEHFELGKFDPAIIKVKVTVKGSDIIVDFSGSSPQMPSTVNAGYAVTETGVLIALKAMLDPTGPIYGGIFRPVEIILPERCIVNPSLDAPIGAHGEIRKRSVGVVMAALSQAVPDLVCAASCGCSGPMMLGFPIPETGKNFLYYEIPEGGAGAVVDLDGASASGDVDLGSTIRIIRPLEDLEAEMPLLMERTELVIDSGGPGKNRGGLTMTRHLRCLADGIFSTVGERGVIPPWGLAGGFWGYPLRVSLVRKGGKKVRDFTTPAKVTGFPVRKGDLLILKLAGGGGYGDPLERDPEKVKDDVEQGYVSRAQASEYYGVVLRNDLSVDKEQTEKLRQKILGQRVWLEVIHSEDYPYEGIRGVHRISRLSCETAEVLQAEDNDLLELLGKSPAPLRAWLTLDPDIQAGIVPLDKLGQSILGVKPGEKVIVRRITGTSRYYDRDTECAIFPLRGHKVP